MTRLWLVRVGKYGAQQSLTQGDEGQHERC